MIPHLVYYQLVMLVLLWLCVMRPSLWPSPGPGAPPTRAAPTPSQAKRQPSNDPKPFEGLTPKPHCALCERDLASPQAPPPVPPNPMPPTTRRPREVGTSQPFCPHSGCDYRGGLDWGNLRAKGHPRGGPWRQFHGPSGTGDFLATHGTLCHGKQAAVELIGRVWACLAAGLGLRATARVCEVAPNTVLHGLVEAAEQLRAFAAYFLCALHLDQLPLDEWYAVLRALKGGEISADEAIKRLERSPSWVWTVMAPKRKWLVVGAVGTRPLAMAQRVVPPVTRVLAPGGVPLFRTDGFKEEKTAILSQVGHWMHPQRRRDKGLMPQPRGRPLPELLYAQVVQSYRRRRLVGGTHRVGFGTQLASAALLAACGWTISTACIERLNLDSRQGVAAGGRRVTPLCRGEASLLEQRVWFQTSHNFVWPHARLRRPLPLPEATNSSGSAKWWRPCTPALAAGLTDHVWSWKEVLMLRVPPWPQPQTV